MWEGRGEVARKPTRKLLKSRELAERGFVLFSTATPPQAGRVSCYLRKLKKDSLPVGVKEITEDEKIF